ncbi:inosine monophosphate dehydrogenase [Candidatus Caldarchaeum subterraneum]|uniref:Inosine-5'-monophosphate dehydrogenase n=1 Tax=Caldiarchaeum subterraneum TaxID=311458 RepID=E6N629_CALS0|nr:inosine monophosphate dehydrogenase [Candidatus Caldarchaeum subterraneum]BAJ50591.1 inosine monophosphate dehydrogenase [Candidatus Caldarchaeum subterraneum]
MSKCFPRDLLAKILEKVGLTFDDVLLLPRRSSIRSRRDVSTRSRFTRRIELEVPIVSAAMDTVTEAEMAVAMAREGGIGVIHRFNTVEQQVEQVKLVKRAENIAVEEPYTIEPEATVAEAEALMRRKNVSGLLVTKSSRKLVGILSRRDILFAPREAKVSEYMTPREKLITAPPSISLEEAKQIFMKHKVEKLPLVDSEWNIKGLITSADIVKKLMHPNASRDSRGRLMVAAAIGVREEAMDRAEALLAAGADCLVIDVAHGHTDMVINLIKQLRRSFGEDFELVAGNVATAEGVEDLAAAGASGVKVGVGPGSVCTTRVVAGVGVPQLTAIMDCAETAEAMGVPIIADGGIRSSADLVKALAAGASTVMIGRLLAGTDESPGAVVVKNGRKMKVYRGMASFYAMLAKESRAGDEDFLQDASEYSFIAEGVEAYVPYKGSASDVVKQLVAGLRSGLSYLGASNIKELQRNAVFIRMTEAGLKESHPHDVETI